MYYLFGGIEKECPYSFLICKSHNNAMHDFYDASGIWMKKINESHPELKNAHASNEVAMLAGLPGEHSDTPAFSEAAQQLNESIMNYCKAMSAMKSQLSPINGRTIYTTSDTNNTNPETIPLSIVPGLNEATILLNQQRDESDLPECVTYSKEKFYKENNPDHPEDIVDRTQGQSIYFYLDLHGHRGKGVRIVFDLCATVTLWLEQTIRD